MKKLFFTAVAVLALSGSGFAEGKVVKSKIVAPNCRDFARGAVWAYYQGGGDSIEAAIALKAAAYAACIARQ